MPVADACDGIRVRQGVQAVFCLANGRTAAQHHGGCQGHRAYGDQQSAEKSDAQAHVDRVHRLSDVKRSYRRSRPMDGLGHLQNAQPRALGLAVHAQ